jgi:UDP-N-acetylmuramate--alanine ligase
MKHVHLIGIGGSGLSAIALFMKERGYKVTGSDRSLSSVARQLSSQGVMVYAGHDAQHVQGADLVIRSSAVPQDNPEVQAAQTAGIPVLKRQDFLAELMSDAFGIAVAGTHGKTTTTAMLAWVLTSLEQDPSYIIGGISKNLGVNAHAGNGSLFVIEADEYDNMFLGLKPQMIVLTNVEHDHPDFFPRLESYLQAFSSFVHLLPPGGELLVCGDDKGAQQLAFQHSQEDIYILRYGTGEDVEYRAIDLHINANGGFNFVAVLNNPDGIQETLVDVSLQVPGSHNVLNALAVLAVIHRLGLSVSQAAIALGAFSGTGRRFDLLGEARGITVIDDYAHHPTEVNATLSAARARYPQRRLWAVWQPHTYSRTVTLLDDFIKAFHQADQVIVTEVFAARESKDDFSAAQVAAKLDHPAVHFSPNFGEASAYLLEKLRPGDVLLVLSAGDADQISMAVLTGLKHKEQENA